MQRSEPLFLPREGGIRTPLLEVIFKLRADERIKRVLQKGNAIQILTNPVILKNVNLGPYSIKIYTDSTSTTSKLRLYMKRKKGLIDGVYHPYISNSGNGCFGTQSSVIELAKTNKDWFGVAMMALDLLKCTTTAEGSGPYRDVNEFLRSVRNGSRY